MKISHDRGACRAMFSTLSAAAMAVAVTGCGSGSAPALAVSDQYPGITCEVVKVPMRDGVELTTFLYKPKDATGKLPVLLARSPYARLTQEACFSGHAMTRIALVSHGYVLAYQAARGTFTSGGTLRLMEQEADDGYDAVEWAGTQPWSTGKVGMTFASYLGLTQWQAALARPPHLAAIAPGYTGTDYHDHWTYVNGVFSPWLNISWPYTSFEMDQIVRAGEAAGKSRPQIDADVAVWQAAMDGMLTWASTLPLTSIDRFKAHQPYFQDWLAHPDQDDYWRRMDVEGRFDQITVPALITGASYDLFNIGSVRGYQGLRSRGGSQAAREGTKLVWNTYGHGTDSGTPSFGNDLFDDQCSMVGPQGSCTLEVRFFDHYLKGLDSGYAKEPNARIYVTVPPDAGDQGSGFWVSGDDFPLPGTVPVRFYLSSGGQANTRSGDGVLSADAPRPGAADRDSFVYDPAHPVPTVGGNICCDTVRVPSGARDQTAVEQRPDVLVYTSEPLAQDLTVIGMAKARFWAASSATDTDFTVKIVDVHPDGKTHNIVDRIVRARYRAGSRLPPSPIAPGVPYAYELEVGNTATVIARGHRLRVQISSSNFPLYARNLNTGADNNATGAFVSARQTLFHGADLPSYIEMPKAPVTR